MNAKTTTVKLSCAEIGCSRKAFELSHAERLLSMPRNGGWYLDDEDFELIDGIITRRHKKEADRASKGGGKK